MKEIKLNNIDNYYFILLDSSAKIHVINNNNYNNVIFLNSKKIKLDEEKNKELYSEKGYLYIFINPEESLNEFNFLVKIEYEKETIEYAFSYSPKSIFKIDKNTSTKSLLLNSDRASFMLLRTNPKLTGNIKLVVDSKNNLYLDTFKINSILSNKLYRHRQVSSESSYSNDIRNIFSSISKRELFEISNDNRNMFDMKNKLSQQYIDTYFYGAKTNYDELYDENFSLFAPLYLNNDLPDFFLIFKLDGVIDKNETFTNSTERLKYFIENGKIIKSFDLRNNTTIGKYLRNIIKENENHSTSVFLSFNDYIPNQWSGISIDRGIVANINESSYSLSQVNNQVDFDRFVTGGFERNGLISSHLINLEFMFNDNSSESFSINRYFGLYVSNVELKKIYNKNNTLYDYYTDEEIDIKNNIVDINNDMLFNITNATDDFFKVKDNDDLIKYLLDNDKKYQNIFQVNTNKNNDIKKYNMLLNINNPLKPGEHLRIIDKEKNIYEIIVGKVDNKKYNTIEEYYDYENYSLNNYNNNNNIFRNIIPGLVDEENDNIFGTNDKNQIIKKQISFILKSFYSILPNDIFINELNQNDIYISSDKKLTFERISSDILYDISIEDINKYNFDSINDITYYQKTIPYILLTPAIENVNDEKYIYQPINFEALNNRLASIVEFIEVGDNVYNIPIEKYKNIDKKTIVKKDNEVILIEPFNLKYYKNLESNDNYNTIELYTLNSNLDNNYIIQTNKNVDNLTINFYSIMPFEINVAGFLSVKDFNFNVLDKKNSFEINGIIQKINGKDQYDTSYYIENKKEDKYTFSEIRDSENSCENIYNYISLNSDISKTIIGKDDLENEIINLYNSSKRMLDISITTPINCKWKLYGRDLLNDKIKSTIFFNSNKENSYRLLSNNTNNYSKIFGFPCVIDDINFDSKLYIKCDFLSHRNNIIYNKGNIFEIINDLDKFVKLFYNYSSNSLECILFGYKFSISINNIKVSDYDDYLFSLICVPNSTINTSPIEFIIDKEHKVILCVWYFGNGNTTLSGRNKPIENKKFIKLNANCSLENNYNSNELNFSLVDNNDYNKIDLNNKNIFISALNNNDLYSYDKEQYTYYFKCKTTNNEGIINADIDIDSSINILYSNYIDTTLNKPTTFFNRNKNNINSYIISNNTDTIKNIFSKNNTFNKDTFNKILKNNNINCYIKDENKVISYMNNVSINFIEANNLYETMTLLKHKPSNVENGYFAYNGYIQPDFINMVEFESSNTIKVDNVNIEYYTNNLTISNVNNINQLWINKIYDIDEVYDNTTFSFDMVRNFDITKTCWDDKFYIKNKNIYINGYECEEEVKTFFGSQGIVLNNNSIEIDDWSNFYSLKENIKDFDYYDDSKYKIEVSLNISNALKNYILTHTNIKNNWKFNQNYQNYAKKYIENLIQKVYSINNKNTIKVYKRKKYSNDVIVPYDNSQMDFIEVKNIKMELLYSNDEYFLSLILPIDEYEYSIKYIIEK